MRLYASLHLNQPRRRQQWRLLREQQLLQLLYCAGPPAGQALLHPQPHIPARGQQQIISTAATVYAHYDRLRGSRRSASAQVLQRATRPLSGPSLRQPSTPPPGLTIQLASSRFLLSVVLLACPLASPPTRPPITALTARRRPPGWPPEGPDVPGAQPPLLALGGSLLALRLGHIWEAGRKGGGARGKV